VLIYTYTSLKIEREVMRLLRVGSEEQRGHTLIPTSLLPSKLIVSISFGKYIYVIKLGLSVNPLVSTFQPSRSAQTREATTEVRLECAKVDVDPELGQVFINWTNNPFEFLDGTLGDKKLCSGKTKHVFAVC